MTERESMAWIMLPSLVPLTVNRMIAYAEWACSDDAGRSSCTLLSAITGVMFERRRCTPSNGCSFGRCVRLVDRFPELRAHIGRVAELRPDWTPIVQAWDELEAMYRAGDVDGVSRRLRDLGRSAVKP